MGRVIRKSPVDSDSVKSADKNAEGHKQDVTLIFKAYRYVTRNLLGKCKDIEKTEEQEDKENAQGKEDDKRMSNGKVHSITENESSKGGKKRPAARRKAKTKTKPKMKSNTKTTKAKAKMKVVKKAITPRSKSNSKKKAPPSGAQNKTPNKKNKKCVKANMSWTRKREIAKEWGFEPGSVWECEIRGKGVVKYVHAGRLVVQFQNEVAKLLKKETQTLFPFKRLTRKVAAQKQSHREKLCKKAENKAKKAENARKRKRSIVETPRANSLRSRAAKGPRLDRTRSGQDYEFLRDMGKSLPKSLTMCNIQPEARHGKFNAYTLGFGVDVRPTTIPGALRRNRGLFSTINIGKNELITEYSGTPINRARAMQLRAQGKATHVKGLNYDRFLDGNRWPQIGQGAAQMANDGKGFTKNNAKFVVKFDSSIGRDRCFLKALEDIKANEEIFVSYGRGFWSNSMVPD
eukprot:CAMPEP_0184502830 /NCGR_PEP_ID=MMETSP0113_2-20130426/51318_1 /TAXON_ID=91329 /ORGANISM="Norrisiella sphaerica, Strain BC52" /LENGTH=459 /DNA_ID=CAMNT_0026892183 /DNA_START=96 /DNA_END=1475 /DNA_ORIENTATION=+